MSDSSTGFVRHFVACNRYDAARFVPLYIGDVVYGYICKHIAPLLLANTNVFVAWGDGLALLPAFNDFASRSGALRVATEFLAAHHEKPLRHENYAVVGAWDETPLAEIDRVAVPWFGVRAWGVHVNGFVRKQDGLYLWVGKRANDRPAAPGKLDNMIGGGQPIGLTLEENLCKEAKEEAGIEANLAMTAVLSRTMDYRVERSDGVRRDTLFIYDMELPTDFTPRNTDGEVESFTLMSLPDVAAIVRDTNKFKFNCNLVIIDFLLRHGFITPQDREHKKLAKWLSLIE